MNKLLFTSFVVLLVLHFSSCTKEDPPTVYYSYGTLTSTGGSVTISTDKGNRLTVLNQLPSAFDNKRVYAEYKIVKNEEPNFEVELYWIDSILTKNIVDTMGLIKRELDSIGYDPIYMRYAQFSGNYLMLNFSYRRYDYTTRHFVNALGYKSVTNDTVHIMLRHNDYAPDNNIPYYYGYSRGFINLEMNSWIPSGKDEVLVYLYDYDGTKSVFANQGTFKRNTQAVTIFNSSRKRDLGAY